MKNVPTPPVPDLARVQGETVEEAARWLTKYFEEQGCPWNYRCGTRATKASYKGLHNVELLLATCKREKIKQSRLSNGEIISLAAPLAFGRNTQVFDLPHRRFQFGRDRKAGYRVPFFFVENGIVKLYFLQPRKNYNPTIDELSFIATVHKRFILDVEFYGLAADVEYVDLSQNAATYARQVSVYSLDTLEIWPESRLVDRLTLLSEALDVIERRGSLRVRRRVAPRPEPDMPLFD